jgi:ribosomal RNA methyltransferase Nop2
MKVFFSARAPTKIYPVSRPRIMEIVRVLGDFKNLREEGVRRKEYIERLVDDIAGYYSYNSYLARKFLEMFSVPEVFPHWSLHRV